MEILENKLYQPDFTNRFNDKRLDKKGLQIIKLLTLTASSCIRKISQNQAVQKSCYRWKYLQGKQMKGYDFHRQKPLDNYIVDFYCKELMLAVEIDGDSHDNENTFDNDIKRQARLESLGINFLRFDDIDVKKNINSVLQVIEEWIEHFENNQQHTP